MSSSQAVLIASDHAGVALKATLQALLPDWKWEDLGPANASRVDYPDFAELLSRKISTKTGCTKNGCDEQPTRGILICGSGIGMCIAANKIPGIRAALVDNPVSARLSREHNDANVLCLGARFLAPEYAADIVRVWLETPFSGDSRHLQRIRKISALEAKGK